VWKVNSRGNGTVPGRRRAPRLLTTAAGSRSINSSGEFPGPKPGSIARRISVSDRIRDGTRAERKRGARRGAGKRGFGQAPRHLSAFLPYEDSDIRLAHTVAYLQNNFLGARGNVVGQLKIELIHSVDQPRR
jgi:hypothetical protein